MKFNLLEFPTQTETSFWVIIIVILGLFVVGSLGASPILMWPIALSMLVLPLRAWLAWPDRELTKIQDIEATAELTQKGILPSLQKTLADLSERAGYPELIKIVVSKQSPGMRSVGTWRRRYLILSVEMAQNLYDDLRVPSGRARACAALLHEIAHFLHQDTKRVGYTRELLRGCFVIIFWWMLFLLGWLGFASLAGQAFLDFDVTQIASVDPAVRQIIEPLITLSPAERAEMVKKVETVSFGLIVNYIVNAFWTVIWMGLVLWLFYWRRMLRLQEHYADYFVNDLLQQPKALFDALLYYEPGSLVSSGSGKSIWAKVVERWEDFKFGLEESLYRYSWYQRADDGWHRIQRLLTFHPTYDERRTFLIAPIRIYADWLSVALTILALVLAMEVLQVTPLIGYHTGSYIIHFTTLAIFGMLSVWALPLMANQEAFKTRLRKILVLVFGVRLAWIVLNFGLIIILSLFAPEFALGVVNSLVVAGWRFAGILSGLPVDDPLLLTLSIIPSYLAMQALSLLVVILLLVVYYRWQQRVQARAAPVNWRRWHWQAMIMLSVAATTLLLTPLSNVIQGDFDRLFGSWRLLTYVLGVGTAVTILIRAWRRS